MVARYGVPARNVGLCGFSFRRFGLLLTLFSVPSLGVSWRYVQNERSRIVTTTSPDCRPAVPPADHDRECPVQPTLADETPLATVTPPRSPVPVPEPAPPITQPLLPVVAAISTAVAPVEPPPEDTKTSLAPAPPETKSAEPSAAWVAAMAPVTIPTNLETTGASKPANEANGVTMPILPDTLLAQAPLLPAAPDAAIKSKEPAPMPKETPPASPEGKKAAPTDPGIDFPFHHRIVRPEPKKSTPAPSARVTSSRPSELPDVVPQQSGMTALLLNVAIKEMNRSSAQALHTRLNGHVMWKEKSATVTTVAHTRHESTAFNGLPGKMLGAAQFTVPTIPAPGAQKAFTLDAPGMQLTLTPLAIDGDQLRLSVAIMPKALGSGTGARAPSRCFTTTLRLGQPWAVPGLTSNDSQRGSGPLAHVPILNRMSCFERGQTGDREIVVLIATESNDGK